MCVAVCPTGIDIRDGQQIECIGCGLCIDACNQTMTKVGRPAGLIRWDTLADQQAKEHCPTDTVVWVTPQGGTYFLKGSASYGSVGVGRYACREGAENAGMHMGP